MNLYESYVHSEHFKQRYPFLKVIRAIEGIPNPHIPRSKILDGSFRYLVPSYEELAGRYTTFTEDMISRMDRRMEKTRHENIIADRIKSATKLQIFQSFWIGTWNVDFFIPSVRSLRADGGPAYNGLVIQIDGPVHNYEDKMRKDEALLKYLSHLNIGITVIPNNDMGHPLVRRVTNEIIDHPRVDARAKKRNFRRIFFESLALNLKQKELSNLYGIPLEEFKMLADRVTRLRKSSIRKGSYTTGVEK